MAEAKQKTNPYPIRWDPELLERARKRARREGVPLSQLIQEYVRAALTMRSAGVEMTEVTRAGRIVVLPSAVASLLAARRGQRKR